MGASWWSPFTHILSVNASITIFAFIDHVKLENLVSDHFKIIEAIKYNSKKTENVIIELTFAIRRLKFFSPAMRTK